jgi:hypothetical protein
VGLFIAKAVTEKMGGTLTVESTLGVGTRFDLVLPHSVAPPHTVALTYTTDNDIAVQPTAQQKLASANAETPSLHGRVLYAEDNLDNQRFVRQSTPSAVQNYPLIWC